MRTELQFCELVCSLHGSCRVFSFVSGLVYTLFISSIKMTDVE